jgi:hypothetical protein
MSKYVPTTDDRQYVWFIDDDGEFDDVPADSLSEEDIADLKECLVSSRDEINDRITEDPYDDYAAALDFVESSANDGNLCFQSVGGVNFGCMRKEEWKKLTKKHERK